MSHPYPVHGIAYATSGLPNPEGQLEVSPRDPGHWPFIGSVIDYLEEREEVRNSRSTKGEPAGVSPMALTLEDS